MPNIPQHDTPLFGKTIRVTQRVSPPQQVNRNARRATVLPTISGVSSIGPSAAVVSPSVQPVAQPLASAPTQLPSPSFQSPYDYTYHHGSYYTWYVDHLGQWNAVPMTTFGAPHYGPTAATPGAGIPAGAAQSAAPPHYPAYWPVNYGYPYSAATPFYTPAYSPTPVGESAVAEDRSATPTPAGSKSSEDAATIMDSV